MKQVYWLFRVQCLISFSFSVYIINDNIKSTRLLQTQWPFLGQCFSTEGHLCSETNYTLQLTDFRLFCLEIPEQRRQVLMTKGTSAPGIIDTGEHPYALVLICSGDQRYPWKVEHRQQGTQELHSYSGNIKIVYIYSYHLSLCILSIKMYLIIHITITHQQCHSSSCGSLSPQNREICELVTNNKLIKFTETESIIRHPA